MLLSWPNIQGGRQVTDLTRYSGLLIRQEVEQLEAFTGFETANRYGVSTPEGSQLMYAYEDSGGISRQFMGSHRPLSIHVVDGGGGQVMSASRGFFWFRSHLYVNDAAGRPVGSLRKRITFLSRKFSLMDANGGQIAQIKGSIFRPHTFIVESGGGEEIGRVTKQWSGMAREAFTDADSFRVQFGDPERSQSFRLLVLAAAFAIDLEYFEK